MEDDDNYDAITKIKTKKYKQQLQNIIHTNERSSQSVCQLGLPTERMKLVTSVSLGLCLE